jgi:hypothetical protein
MCVSLWHIRYTGLYNKIIVGYKNFVRTQGQLMLFLPCQHFQHCDAENAEFRVEVIAIYGLRIHLMYCTLYWVFNSSTGGLVRHWTVCSWTKQDCSNQSVTTKLLRLSLFNILCDVFWLTWPSSGNNSNTVHTK